MNRTNLITNLRNAKKAATVLSGRNTAQTEQYNSCIIGIDALFDELGERKDPYLSANVESRKASVGRPRFGSTPPNLLKSTSVALKIEEEGKDAGVAKVDAPVIPLAPAPAPAPPPAPAPAPAPESDTYTDNEIEAAIEGAANVGLITETEATPELLGSIAASTVAALAKRFESKATIAKIIVELGGTPMEGGTKNQLAKILKDIAKSKLK